MRRDVLWYLRTLPRKAARDGVDVLHCPGHRGPRRSRVPLVVTLHDLAVLRHPETFNRWTRTYSRIMLPRIVEAATRVIAVSSFTAGEAVELLGVDEGKIRVVPHGVEPPFLPDGQEVRGEYALAVGTVEPRKNLPRAVEAAQRAGIELRVVGPEGWGDVGVQSLGFVSDEVLAALYRGAQCLVYPSLYEGFGLPVLEAMACGTPVVTSNFGATAELARDAAVLVDPYDVDAIAAGIDEARRRRERASCGRARARSPVHVGRDGAPDARRLPRGGRMIDVLLDADVLGRQRTGDETYVRNLLRELPGAAPDLRFAAVTRKPELVPPGVEPIELAAGSQEWRMAWSLPRLVRRLRPRIAHFQHSLPLFSGGRSVLTVHDLSFEREPGLMPRKDRLVFRTVVPRSAKRADRLIAVSERTKEDLADLYGIPEAAVEVIPHGIDPIFTPDDEAADAGYLLVVGAVQRRKDPRAAVEAGNELGMPVVVVGPEREPALARELRGLGADVRGYVAHEELPGLYREASALVVPSRYEGFGLPVLEAMASGTPVVAAPDPALVEVAGDAAVFADQGDLSGAILHALDRRAELRAAGLERASQVQLGRGRAPDGRGVPEPAVSISGVVVVHEPVPELERCLSALKPQVDDLVVVSNLGVDLAVPEGATLIRNDEPVGFAANANRGIAETSGEFVALCNPDTEADPGALAVLLAFAEFHPRMGIAGPELRKPDGSWNPSRRRFPTVSGTIVRRTPLRRWLGGTQRAHYGLDEQPAEPVQADWLLGAFLFLRREMLDELGGFDEGYRLYGEDIDLAYRASKAGWERWYVPAAKAVHAHQAVTDRRLLTRRTLWHWRGIVRFVRKHPERLKAP